MLSEDPSSGSNSTRLLRFTNASSATSLSSTSNFRAGTSQQMVHSKRSSSRSWLIALWDCSGHCQQPKANPPLRTSGISQRGLLCGYPAAGPASLLRFTNALPASRILHLGFQSMNQPTVGSFVEIQQRGELNDAAQIHERLTSIRNH